MADTYKPIDMRDYPYKAGDILPGGITIQHIVRGDDKDSSKGLRCKEVIGLNDDAQPIFGDKIIIVADHIDAMDGKKHRRKLLIVGIEPDPDAQYVYFKVEGQKKDNRMRPAEFARMVESNKALAEKEKGKK